MHPADRDALKRLLDFLRRPDVDDHRGRLMAQMMVTTVLSRRRPREGVSLAKVVRLKLRQIRRARRAAGVA